MKRQRMKEKEKEKKKAPLPCERLQDWRGVPAEPPGDRAGRGSPERWAARLARQRCAPGAGSFPEPGWRAPAASAPAGRRGRPSAQGSSRGRKSQRGGSAVPALSTPPRRAARRPPARVSALQPGFSSLPPGLAGPSLPRRTDPTSARCTRSHSRWSPHRGGRGGCLRAAPEGSATHPRQRAWGEAGN